MPDFIAGSGRINREDGTTANYADLADEAAGGKGFEYISDTAAHTPAAGRCFRSLQILTDTVISAFTADTTAPITGTITGVTFSAGTWLYGKFTSITLTSGTLIAYKGIL